MYLAPALLLSVMSFTPASAAPVAPLSAPAVESPLIQAQYHRDRYHATPRHRPAPRYRAGHRYRSAPHGWHRYSRRPGDWSRRGCILVGPVWFCP
jgi:hypothetical protein